MPAATYQLLVLEYLCEVCLLASRGMLNSTDAACKIQRAKGFA